MSKISEPSGSVLEYVQVTVLPNMPLKITPLGTPLVPFPMITKVPPLLNTASVARLPDSCEPVVKVTVPRSPVTGPFPPRPTTAEEADRPRTPIGGLLQNRTLTSLGVTSNISQSGIQVELSNRLAPHYRSNCTGMGWDTSSKLSALISPVGRDLSRHWQFSVAAAVIAEDESLSDRVARSRQKSAGNVAPQGDSIERIVVGKAA